MSDKLKLVDLPKLTESEESNFWKCCPLKLEYLPTKHCKFGNPNLGEPSCAWWINSAEHNYCFWKFIRAKSNSEGQMKELAQTDLARLFGWSNTKAHFMLKEALLQLIEVLKEHDAMEDFEDLVEEEISDIAISEYSRDKT